MKTEVTIVQGRMHVKDPIYDKPYIMPEYMTNFFQTPEVKRLDDIKQLGYKYVRWPEANSHTRYGHSIGVAYLYSLWAPKVVEILKSAGIETDEEEVEIAGLVSGGHDLGHIFNSHVAQTFIKYPHEARTADILLGNENDPSEDTEVAKLLRSKYSKEKVEKIVNVLRQVEEGKLDKSNLSPFLQVWTQFLSSSIDGDKLDYTVRDSKYTGIKTRVNPLEIIKGFDIDIDETGEFCLIIPEKLFRTAENLNGERYQNYRDIYYDPIDEIMKNVEPIILDLAKSEPESVQQNYTPAFNIYSKAASEKSGKRVTTLKEELAMTNTPIEQTMDYLVDHAQNPILRYLCDFKQNISDYLAFETERELKELLQELQEIFPDVSTNSLFQYTTKSKLLKPTEDFYVKLQNGNLVKASEYAASLIKPKVYTRTRTYFNPELLRLELRMEKDEFERVYGKKIKKFIQGIAPKQEFESKYTIKSASYTKEQLIETLRQMGFELLEEQPSTYTIQDKYLETQYFDLLQNGQSLRVRTVDGKTFVDYKEDVKGNDNFSTRIKIEKLLKSYTTNLPQLKQTLGAYASQVFDKPIIDVPYMDIATQRTPIILSGNGAIIYVNWDECDYKNNWLHSSEEDTLITIGCIGGKRLALKGIEQELNKHTEELVPCKQSKIGRAAKLTHKKKREERENNSHEVSSEIERELKFKYVYTPENREKIGAILQSVLQSANLKPVSQPQLKAQVDTYYDTKGYHLAKEKASLRIRSKKGKLIGTYKAEGKKGSIMFSRPQTEAEVEENSAKALYNTMQLAGVNLPTDLSPVLEVQNQRNAQNFEGDKFSIEVSTDRVINVNFATRNSCA